MPGGRAARRHGPPPRRVPARRDGPRPDQQGESGGALRRGTRASRRPRGLGPGDRRRVPGTGLARVGRGGRPRRVGDRLGPPGAARARPARQRRIGAALRSAVSDRGRPARLRGARAQEPRPDRGGVQRRGGVMGRARGGERPRRPHRCEPDAPRRGRAGALRLPRAVPDARRRRLPGGGRGGARAKARGRDRRGSGGDFDRAAARARRSGATIAEAAEDFDLLAIGSRAYGPVRRALLGSVSARLVSNAPCPILVLPRGAGSDPLGLEGTDAGSVADPALG
jgi:hypothetical protein